MLSCDYIYIYIYIYIFVYLYLHLYLYLFIYVDIVVCLCLFHSVIYTFLEPCLFVRYIRPRAAGRAGVESESFFFVHVVRRFVGRFVDMFVAAVYGKAKFPTGVVKSHPPLGTG